MKAGSGVRCNEVLPVIFLLSVIMVSCEKQESDFQNLLYESELPQVAAIQDMNEVYYTETFTIASKDGLSVHRSLENPDFRNYENFSITIQNGQSGRTKVTRMEISLDGNVLITYRDFKRNVSSVTRQIPGITSSSWLDIKLEGSPGRFVVITITAEIKVSSLNDIDGNVYRIVKIGNQWWMAENLKTTKFNDGTAIPEVKENSEWLAVSADHLPAFSWYDNNIGNKSIYGALYNWTAAGNDKICPAGWHVPDSYEFLDLCLFIDPDAAIGYFSGIAGGVLKEAGLSHWASPNTGATDELGFTALPGGIRNADGAFGNLSYAGSWWLDNGLSSSNMLYNDSVAWFSEGGNELGRSIRCLKDN